ncbi:hypothetical protein UJ101_01106 [Flavobacteriaceae bacterium UJ101]|nr:hypothetical protein UJ101_01106 [Flavobacteriaceae bacterium UJ101]
MKKFLLSAVLVTAGLFIFGQEKGAYFQKGKKFIGGSLQFERAEDSNKDKTTSTKLIPQFGYFIKNDVAIGLGAGYQRTEMEAVNSDFKKYTLDPFIRKYWIPSQRLGLFAQADASLGWGKEENDGTTFVWGINVRPGVTYFFSDKIAFDSTLGRLGYNDNGNDARDYGIGLSLEDVTLGFRFFF